MKDNNRIPIINSTDEHFNDIPLKRWDSLSFHESANKDHTTGLKKAGDYMTLAGSVCIYKEAARQIRNQR